MIQQEKRIKIAEACEFKPLEFVPPKRGEFIFEQNNFRRWKKAGKTFHADDLPDYFIDLNAMREALSILTDMQWHDYEQHLREVCDGMSHCEGAGRELLHSTAPQQAEAFGKTLNLW